MNREEIVYVIQSMCRPWYILWIMKETKIRTCAAIRIVQQRYCRLCLEMNKEIAASAKETMTIVWKTQYLLLRSMICVS